MLDWRGAPHGVRCGGCSMLAGAAARLVASSLVALLLAIVLAPRASAQREPTPEDRQAAAEAYDRGTRAFLAHEYSRAAQFFETAYRLAPNAAALIQAVRSYDRADDDLRAATLALRLAAFHGDDRQAAREAERALRDAGTRFVRVDVTCDGCTLELDGAILGHTSFFLAPGGEHSLRASFSTGVVSQQVSGSAGETRSLSFEAPPPPPPPPDTTDDAPPPDTTDDAPPVEQTTSATDGGGMSPAFALIALGATAVAGGILVWSGVDALDGVPAYEAMPTPERLADGQSRELRTNVLIGVTGALAVTTVLLLAFTDWDGSQAATDEAPSARLMIVPTVDGGAAVVEGRF